jgi:3',5'-cyclic AMP phosphodiesterase CpdA
MSSFHLAHLSDTHISAPGKFLFNGVDGSVQLQKAIDWMMEDQVTIDATLITGDLTQDGHLEEYQHLHQILEPLAKKMPIYLVMGNHDNYQNFSQVFFDYPQVVSSQSIQCLQYTFRMGDYQFIVLDSLELGDDQGHLRTERLRWLDLTLRSSLNKTVLVVHHPMIDIGNRLMDEMHLFETEEFGEIVQKNSQIKLILCGHIHRTICGQFRGVPVIVAPSTAHQYPVNITHASAKVLSKEAPGFLIHTQIDGENLLTHHIPISHFLATNSTC